MDFLLFSDLPHDLIHDKIGAYLLKDPNKTIHKIFKDKEDDDLQILLFGEVKDLTYTRYIIDNCIDYPMNNKLKDYVNYILKAKGVRKTCEEMMVRYYNYQYKNYLPENKVKIIFYNKAGKLIASIENVYYKPFMNENALSYLRRTVGKDNYMLSYRKYNEWYEQYIGKSDIIQEYNKIHKEITEICFF